MSVNGWRVMWVICVYDCPVTDAEARHDYSVFHKALLRENFVQLQKSLYVHHFPTLAAADAVIRRLRLLIPPEAQVAFFIVTDKQYGMTREFFGPAATKKSPMRLSRSSFSEINPIHMKGLANIKDIRHSDGGVSELAGADKLIHL